MHSKYSRGLFIGQDAGFHVLLVEGDRSTGPIRPLEMVVPGLLFQTGEHLGEVLGLNGFVEVASRVGGHVFGVFSHADEFGLADRIGASLRRPCGRVHFYGAQFYGKGDHKGVRYALRFKLILQRF